MIVSKYEVTFRWNDYRPGSSNSGCITRLFNSLQEAKDHVTKRFEEDDQSVVLMPNSLMAILVNEENMMSWVVRIDKNKVFVKYYTIQMVLDEIDKEDV